MNDAYNANPDSMYAALDHLADRAGDRRRVAILGEMAELGSQSELYHGQIGDLAADLGIDGDRSRGRGARLRAVAWAAGGRRRLRLVRSFVRPGDAVLVKASRAVGLEGIADEIANFARA